MAGALAAFKLIETVNYVTGPFLSRLLADMEAERRGDPFRDAGEKITRLQFNRKPSVTLDLRADQGRNIAFKTRLDCRSILLMIATAPLSCLLVIQVC